MTQNSYQESVYIYIKADGNKGEQRSCNNSVKMENRKLYETKEH